MAIELHAVCAFCGKRYVEHVVSYPEDVPPPKAGCLLLREHFVAANMDDPITNLVVAQRAALSQPTEQRAPTAPGWWARTRGGRTAWFRVDEIEDATGTELMIWTSSIEDFLPASKFCGALTRWFGPVALPPKWEKEESDG